MNHFEKSRRGFLWYGNGINKAGKCLVRWDIVCLPKFVGGLGVLDLKTQNKALLTKYLFKFFNKHNIPWVKLLWSAYYNNGNVPAFPTKVGSFSWRDCCSVLNEFKAMTICKINSGTTALLWHDIWYEDIFDLLFPQLFSFAKDMDITVADAHVHALDDFYEIFYLPMSATTVQQSNKLLQILTQMQNTDLNDCWNFKWSNIIYSTKIIYLELFGNPADAPKPFSWTWKYSCLPKQKFFFWLLLHDRLNTKDMMQRKIFYVESTSCVLCDDNQTEDFMHLFFSSDFSHNFWLSLGFQWGTDINIMDMLVRAKSRMKINCFKECLTISC